MKKELVTTAEMAAILKVSDRTFRDYIDEYELPFIRIGKRKRFEPEKVLRQLETRGERAEPPVYSKSKVRPEIRKPNDRFRKELGL